MLSDLLIRKLPPPEGRRAEVFPKIGSKRLGGVKKSDVRDLVDAMVDRGSGVNANRLLSVLRPFFNWSVERGLISVSPCDNIKAPTAEASRVDLGSDAAHYLGPAGMVTALSGQLRLAAAGVSG